MDLPKQVGLANSTLIIISSLFPFTREYRYSYRFGSSIQPSKLKVVVNGRVRLPTIGEKPQEERIVQEIIHHPNYSHGSVYFDAALLILDRPYDVNQTKFINKICLPPPGLTLNNLKCVVAGFGKGKESEKGKFHTHLNLKSVN